MKKIWTLLGVIMLLVTILQVRGTYAKYSSTAEATIQKQAGAWAIKINNSDILAGNVEKKFNIDSLIYPSNDYVLENKIAPSSNGYFDIVIDTTGTSVATKFDVTIDKTQLEEFDAISFEAAYMLINGQEKSENITRTAQDTYSGIISLQDVKDKKSTSLRFYIKWENDAQGRNDERDSQLGLTKNLKIRIPIEVSITHYMGEQLVEYTP